MDADRLLQGLGEVPPKMPPVRDLFRLRGAGAGALRVGTGPVPADDLHLGVTVQPVGQRRGVPAGQHIERPAGLQVDEEGGVRIALAQREIVHAQHSDLGRRRFGDGSQEMQEGVLRNADAQRVGKPRPGTARQHQGDRGEHRSKQWCVAGMRAGQPLNLLGECHRRATGVEAFEAPHQELDHDGGRTDGCVSEAAPVPPVHPPGRHRTGRTSRRERPARCTKRDHPGHPLDRLHDHTR